MSVTAIARPGALSVYASALHRVMAGRPCELTAVDGSGAVRVLRLADWCGSVVDGDHGLLRRCSGPVLDIGCGPGRLAGALAARGHAVLGIDVCADAVRLTRRRGAPALHRNVFAPLPAEGKWRRLLLADGNIGISGDPERLLRRCRELAAPDGRVLVEADPPGTPTWAGRVRISADGGPASEPFPWAYVGADDLEALARSAGLRILHTWMEADRWFAGLAPA